MNNNWEKSTRGFLNNTRRLTWRPPEQGQAETGYGDHGRPTARWYDPHTGGLYETMQMVPATP
jgi:hypothetical protein